MSSCSVMDHISGGSTVYDDLDRLVVGKHVMVGRLFSLHTSQSGCSFFDDVPFLQGLSAFSGFTIKNVCDLVGSVDPPQQDRFMCSGSDLLVWLHKGHTFLWGVWAGLWYLFCGNVNVWFVDTLFSSSSSKESNA